VTVQRSIQPWLVGLVGLAVGVLITIRVLATFGMDPTAFVGFDPTEAPSQVAYPREVLGRPVVSHPLAHDGKYFFAQANDPWYLDPQRHAAVLDAPLYRAQRMLYPTVASGFGLLPPGVVVWSLLATNVLALALGAMLAARLAGLWSLSPWLGVWVPLNIGLILDVDLGTAGVVAYTCCLGGLYALAKGRTWTASLLFGAAALSRETMVLFAVGVFALWWFDRRERPWRFVITPLSLMVAWNVYLRFRLQGVSGVGSSGAANLAPPFVGLYQALGSWMERPQDLLLNLTILVIAGVSIPLAVRSRLSIAWGALPFVVLGACLSEIVWRQTYDFPRALAPIFTAIPFLLAASHHHDGPEQVGMRTMDVVGTGRDRERAA
jgi:hypothetical protein